MQRLRTVTSLDVSAVAGHHAMPAALLFSVCVGQFCHAADGLRQLTRDAKSDVNCLQRLFTRRNELIFRVSRNTT